LPRRRLFLSPDFKIDPQTKVKSPFPGTIGIDKYATELAHNQALRDLVSTLPSFGFHFAAQVAFNAETFRAIKAEKFTGLVERPDTGTEHMGYLADRNVNWNVGHFV
jgi:hypothetical protein